MGDHLLAILSEHFHRIVVGDVNRLAFQRNGASEEAAPNCDRADVKRLTGRRRPAPWERLGNEMDILGALC